MIPRHIERVGGPLRRFGIKMGKIANVKVAIASQVTRLKARQRTLVHSQMTRHGRLANAGRLAQCGECRTKFLCDHVSTLYGQAEMLRHELTNSAAYLRSLRHSIAYVGGINVGKTTALCVQAGLMLDGENRLEGTLMDTGGGRVTICDIIIRPADAISIEVEPLTEEEVYRLVVDFCHGLIMRARSAKLGAEDVGVPEEIDRAIRSMSGLTRIRRRGRSRSLPSSTTRPPWRQLSFQRWSYESANGAKSHSTAATKWLGVGGLNVSLTGSISVATMISHYRVESLCVDRLAG
jgi:hypothetical protein